MPMKMQYPVQLHPDTKCPMCNTAINSLGGNVYVCTAGHVIEGILLVTMTPKKPQEPVKVVDKVQDVADDKILTPSYNPKKVTQ